ncbi:MAG: LVIVD repeat-containing protein [Longimicrobiales bacterium]
MKLKLMSVLAACFALAACDNNGTGTLDPNPDTVSFALAVAGRGEVTERYTSEVAAAGEWVYTGTWSTRATRGNALKIWNTAAAGAPVLRDSIIVTGAGTLGDVQISQDGTLLVVPVESGGAVNGIYIYDRTNPARPTLLGQFTATSTRSGVHTVKLGTVNNRHYAFLSIDPPARLVIVDITDPRSPVQVLERAMGNPYVHDVFVRDGLLFTALWDDGVTIWDIGGGNRGGSPAAPVQISNVIPVNGNVHNVHWFHDPTTSSKRYAFIGEEVPTGVPFGQKGSSAGDIHVLDVSNLAAPREVAFFHVDSAGVHNFAVDEQSGILYAAYYNAGVRALDIRGDLGNCTASQRAPDGRCDLGLMKRERGTALTDRVVFIWGVALQGNALYASDMLSGVWRIDITPLKR